MFMFKSKKAKIKLNFIKELRNIQKVLEDKNLNKESYSINAIIDMLNDEYLNLSSYQIDYINEAIGEIKGLAINRYQNAIKGKISNICNVLGGINVVETPDDKLIDNNISVMMDEIEILEKQSEHNARLMDQYLGKNKNQWCFYNAQKENCDHEIEIKTSTFLTLLKTKSTRKLQIASKESTKLYQIIERYSAGNDIDEYTSNIEFVSEIDDEVDTINDSFMEVHNNKYGNSASNSAYEKALEAKTLKDASTIKTKVKSSPLK